MWYNARDDVAFFSPKYREVSDFAAYDDDDDDSGRVSLTISPLYACLYNWRERACDILHTAVRSHVYYKETVFFRVGQSH